MKLQQKKRFSFYFCLFVSSLIILNFWVIGSVHSLNLKQSDRQVPLLDNLGNHHHEITTRSPQAQAYFDQGLTLIFGFNHAEAFRSFQQATKLDSDCAMCYAGMALALGPNINAAMKKEAAHSPLLKSFYPLLTLLCCNSINGMRFSQNRNRPLIFLTL